MSPRAKTSEPAAAPAEPALVVSLRRAARAMAMDSDDADVGHAGLLSLAADALMEMRRVLEVTNRQLSAAYEENSKLIRKADGAAARRGKSESSGTTGSSSEPAETAES